MEMNSKRGDHCLDEFQVTGSAWNYVRVTNYVTARNCAGATNYVTNTNNVTKYVRQKWSMRDRHKLCGSKNNHEEMISKRGDLGVVAADFKN